MVRSVVISVKIIRAVIKRVAEAFRVNIKIYKSKPTNSAECFNIILFILYSFFEIMRDSGGRL